MDKLRFGVIGVGGRGICNAQAVNARDDVELVGVCDIRQERLDLCDAQGLAGRRFLDYRDLLECDLDAVCINTDNDVHCEQTLAAAERGIHVYCEKPIALTVEDAESMVEATRGLATVVNLSMRAEPSYRYLRQLLDERRWGRLLAVGALHPKVSGLLCQGKGHKATRDPATWGPILMHDGVHICEWLRWMGGPMTAAYARTLTTGDDPANEELISAVTTHEDDVMGSLSYHTMPFLPGGRYVICEEASVWAARDENGPHLHVARAGEEPENLPVPPEPLSGDAFYVDQFIRAIREGLKPYATMADGLAGQRIVDAIRCSGLTGQVVALQSG
ncbi:MAG: Gfo/Idh/MocA family oxidoreductase [Armatimonadetes bacterium]|nr:Gfo/Idh/MocA family oxidoreductase [Armatimonadota bacterium]